MRSEQQQCDFLMCGWDRSQTQQVRIIIYSSLGTSIHSKVWECHGFLIPFLQVLKLASVETWTIFCGALGLANILIELGSWFFFFGKRDSTEVGRDGCLCAHIYKPYWPVLLHSDVFCRQREWAKDDKWHEIDKCWKNPGKWQDSGWVESSSWRASWWSDHNACHCAASHIR